MADNVITKVGSAPRKVLNGVERVSDVKRELDLGDNYVANVNGTPASDSSAIGSGDFVTFSTKKVGGRTP